MSLLQMSLAGGVMILVITVIRALAMDHVPKRTFPVLWGIALFRLLIPLSLPSAEHLFPAETDSGAGNGEYPRCGSLRRSGRTGRRFAPVRFRF